MELLRGCVDKTTTTISDNKKDTNKNANMKSKQTFQELGVEDWLCRQCASLAMHRPTSIQRLCIPAILHNHHVAGKAETGSGKTAAFALPILQVLSHDMYGVCALVLTASRELAYQIIDQFIALGAPIRIRTLLAIGGVRHEEQLDGIKSRPHVVVATPGRLRYLFETFHREMIPAFGHLRFLVLDEADRLTDGDMQNDVRMLLELLPSSSSRQVLLFSATLSLKLLTHKNKEWSANVNRSINNDNNNNNISKNNSFSEVIKTISHDTHDSIEDNKENSVSISWLEKMGVKDTSSLHIFEAEQPNDKNNCEVDGEVQTINANETQDKQELTQNTHNHTIDNQYLEEKQIVTYSMPSTLQHRYIFIPNMVKLPNLVAALRAQGKEQLTMVFTNSALRAELVRLTLQLLGFPVCSLDSLLTQQHRLDNLALFKLGLARIMVCTDISARGLDIPLVELVIHYDVPKHSTTYVHRVGRTARAGRAGVSVAFITEFDVQLIQRIERQVGVTMTKWEEGKLTERKVLSLLDEVSAAKVEAKQQVTTQFGNRAATHKEQAANKKAQRAEELKKQMRRTHKYTHDKHKSQRQHTEEPQNMNELGNGEDNNNKVKQFVPVMQKAEDKNKLQEKRKPKKGKSNSVKKAVSLTKRTPHSKKGTY